MEKVIGITEIRTEIGTIVEKVHNRGDVYIIQRHGKPAAAVVPLEIYEQWKRERDAFFDTIRGVSENVDLTPDQAGRIASEAIASVRTDQTERE